jgi:hypothetical protein
MRKVTCDSGFKQCAVAAVEHILFCGYPQLHNPGTDGYTVWGYAKVLRETRKHASGRRQGRARRFATKKPAPLSTKSTIAQEP